MIDEESGPVGWARPMWRVFEPIHAVTYFAPEARSAYDALGLKGFWMGYFAGRAAPFGVAPAALVTATFFNFRPSMVERALPDAWAIAEPAAVLDARLHGAELALSRLLGGAVHTAGLVEAVELIEAATDACEVDGRPVFAALKSIDRPVSTLGRLWHAAGLLREHRGDGHVAANLAHGVTGLGSHVFQAASGAVPRYGLQAARGWTDDEWEQTERLLGYRGWLAPDGRLTDRGRAVRQQVERVTDELAAAPWAALGLDAVSSLHRALRPLAAAIVGDHGVPAQSPLGDLRTPSVPTA